VVNIDTFCTSMVAGLVDFISTVTIKRIKTEANNGEHP
jgi:hypothetical protein